MIFSELSLAERDLGLDYFPENAALCGEKHGLGVCVYDIPDENRYAVSIFAEIRMQDFSVVAAVINEICEGLPKNTIVSHSETASEIRLFLMRDAFLQEKITALIEFLDKLTAALSTTEIKGKPPRLEKKPTVSSDGNKSVEATNTHTAHKIKLRFDKNSVKGIFGALIASVVCVVLSVLSVNLDSVFFIGELYAVLISALSALLIIFDYGFLARKIDVCGLILNSALTFLTIYASSYIIGIKEYLRLMPEKSISEIIREYSSLTSQLSASNPEITAFQLELFTKGLFAAAAASAAAYLFYFRRNSAEMYSDEKTIKKEKSGK